MAKAVKNLLGTTTAFVLPAAAATLASSATVAVQTDAVDFKDANGLVPPYADIEVAATLANSAPANDKTLYVYLAESVDGTSYSGGNPAVGASAATYTFASAPVGTSALPTTMRYLGAMVFNAAAQSLRKPFRVYDPKNKGVLVLLNYAGQALTACTAQYRIASGDIR